MPPHQPLPSSSPAHINPLGTVVVVDDDPEIVSTLSDLLRAEGFTVSGFTDPTVALAELRAGPAPDLVLTDVIMPDLSGAELADALTQAGVTSPVVLMTALADPEFCVDTARRRVLNKPFFVDDLLAEIDEATRATSGVRRIA